MTKPEHKLSDILEPTLGAQWDAHRTKFEEFVTSVDLQGAEFSQALMILPKATSNQKVTLEETRRYLSPEELWTALTATMGGKSVVVCFPVKSDLGELSPSEALRSTFIDVHSRLVAWWLVNAWRSQQLVRATWELGDSFQTIPAAACGRSLLETASAFRLEFNALADLWRKTKSSVAESAINLEHWHRISTEVYTMMWATKFDDKASPKLSNMGKVLPRRNVLTSIEKLAKVTDAPVQDDYQWLCNAVHPSIGGMLSFASPLMMHDSKTCAMQYVSRDPIYVESRSEKWREVTIQEALARAAILAVEVLCSSLDDALRIVDDIALTTGAARLANFDYWRKLVPPKRGSVCPCRSGKRAESCKHDWTTWPISPTHRFAGFVPKK